MRAHFFSDPSQLLSLMHLQCGQRTCFVFRSCLLLCLPILQNSFSSIFFRLNTKDTHFGGFKVRSGSMQNLDKYCITFLWSLADDDITVRSSAKPLTLWGKEEITIAERLKTLNISQRPKPFTILLYKLHSRICLHFLKSRNLV